MFVLHVIQKKTLNVLKHSNVYVVTIAVRDCCTAAHIHICPAAQQQGSMKMPECFLLSYDVCSYI
jgi:hypothetical protein